MSVNEKTFIFEGEGKSRRMNPFVSRLRWCMQAAGGQKQMMMVMITFPAVLVMVFLWIGFVSAISFMEAGLKFRAPGITLPLGLGIGKIIFKTMNKVEWVLAAAILINIVFYNSAGIHQINFHGLVAAYLILGIQTFWALPALHKRAKSIIDGIALPPSRLHIYYVAMEVFKLTALFLFGINLFS